MNDLEIATSVTVFLIILFCFLLNKWRCCSSYVKSDYSKLTIATYYEKGAVYQNEELKTDKGALYLEEKFPVIIQPQFVQFFSNSYNLIISSPEIWTFIIFAVVFTTSFFHHEVDKSTADAYNVFIVAFSALFSVLIALLFSNGMEKNKENKRLYQALCGDIKGMAMWLSALTNDEEKYRIQYNETGEKVVQIDARDSVEIEMAKIRLLLCVLAPVAKHVLRNAPISGNEGPQYRLLDDKYRVKIIYPKDWWGKIRVNPPWWLGCIRRRPEYEIDHSQAWGKLQACTTETSNMKGKRIRRDTIMKEPVTIECDDNQMKVYLYRKIRYLSETTKMDLFEVVMYCLLDQINVLQEKTSIGTLKNYSKERDLVSKWQHIYSSWGTMYSLSTYDQPTMVHVTICLSLIVYTYCLAASNRMAALESFQNGENAENNWSNENADDFYIGFYVMIKTLMTVLPFTLFWIYSRVIGKVFKKSNGDAPIIKKDARDTQEQVSKLLSVRAILDTKDMLQFDIDYDEQRRQARDRKSIASGRLYPSKNESGVGPRKFRRGSVVQPKDNESEEETKRRDEIKRRATIRFKNVNF